MNKFAFFVSGFLIIGSALLNHFIHVYAVLDMLRCLMLAYGLILFGFLLCFKTIKQQHKILFYLAVIIILIYTILAIDTYLMHAITWFPGIIRYPLFSMYGLWYLIFIPIGVCLCFYEKRVAS